MCEPVDHFRNVFIVHANNGRIRKVAKCAMDAITGTYQSRTGEVDELIPAAGGLRVERSYLRSKHGTRTARPAVHITRALSEAIRSAGGIARIDARRRTHHSDYVRSRRADRQLAPYIAQGTAKAALESLVRYFAWALAKRGITVNAISP